MHWESEGPLGEHEVCVSPLSRRYHPCPQKYIPRTSFTLPVKTLTTIMRELNHSKIDVCSHHEHTSCEWLEESRAAYRPMHALAVRYESHVSRQLESRATYRPILIADSES